jgi:protein-S-isoprenylcysteine O-methyltransferase Ste14
MGATNSNVGLDCDRLDWRSIAARNGLQVQGCAVSENLALWLAHQLRQLSDVHSNAPRLILALSLSSYGDRTDPAYGDRTHPATNCVPAHAVLVAAEKARPSSVQAGPAIISASIRFRPTAATKADATMTVTPSMAIFTLVGTLAYLGLAVVGWGGPTAFFSHSALSALTVITFLLSGAALFSGGNLSPGIREDRSNRWVLAAFGVIGLLAGYLPAYTDRIGFWTFDGELVRWLSVILFAAGGALRIWPVFVLRNRFSGLVAIQPEHSLVTNGVYGVIRHPSYLGLLVNSLGWALAFRSMIGVLLTAFTIPPLLARIRAEETLLRSQFGGEYDAYCARTSRLIPWLY